MEFLNPYINISNIEFNWVNLILVGSFIVYFILWLTLLTGFHKRANSLPEYLLRNFLIIPFWLLFVLNVLESTVPNLHLNFKETQKKEIEIINQTKESVNFSFFLENTKEKVWKPAYVGFQYFSIDYFNLKAESEVSSYIEIDTSKYDDVLVKMILPDSDRKYGIKIKGNEVPTKLYVSELKDEILLDLDHDFSFQYYKIIVFSMAIFFLWYHYGLLLRKVHRRRFIIFGSLITIYCLLMILIYSRTIFLKDIIWI